MSEASQTSRKLDDYGPVQAAKATGIASWRHGVRFGLIPAPDVNGKRWSAAVVEDAIARADELTAEIGRRTREEYEQICGRASETLGANRIAELLTETHDLGVVRDDVEELVGRGLLEAAGEYKGWPLYPVDRALEVEAGVIADIVGERQAWVARSLPSPEAAKRLGWRLREWERVVADRGLEPGRGGRWSLSLLKELAADEALCAHVLAERTLGPEQAAAHLNIRRLDFDHLVAAELVEPAEIVPMKVGYRSEVEVPMYRTADLDDLLCTPDLPWNELHGVKRGDRSPLADVVGGLPPTRAQMVRAFARRLAKQHTIEVHPRYHAGSQRWILAWELLADGTPTVEQVRAAMEADPLNGYADELTLDTAVGEIVRQARALVEPGAAVVLDFETTGLAGEPIEAGVVDAATGTVLLDKLINPDGLPIEAGATAVHGLTDQDLKDAPTWPQAWPHLVEAVAERTIVSYNAAFDRARLRQACDRHGIDPGHLGRKSSWWCAMEARQDYLGSWWPLPLGGGHRAAGDALAAQAILQGLTAFPVAAPHRT